MAIEQIFDSASSVMTVISFTTFCGILLWTFALKRGADFDKQAALPFADEVGMNVGLDIAPAREGENDRG